MPNTIGTQIARSLDWVVCKTAAVTFNSIQYFNKRNPNPSVTPQWSDKPLLKSWEKTKPTLGFPRQTDSLCPGCVKEAREAIIAGKKDWRDLMHEKVGEIKAQIIERDDQGWMEKDCPLRGAYEEPECPGRRRRRTQDRLQLGSGRDQRHRIRQEQGILQEGVRSGYALRLPAIRRHRQ